VVDQQEMSYEAARDELADVVRRLEAGGTTLEESLTLWERGEQLATICQHWLDGARARLEAVRSTADPAGAGRTADAPSD
jgi:exodeoxyribonuclease VII small subunit